jgi:hypothetical protein
MERACQRDRQVANALAGRIDAPADVDGLMLQKRQPELQKAHSMENI